jgi:hypothetical protein
LNIPADERAKFMADNPKLFGLVWALYMDWRKTRAKSCKNLLAMNRVLNVTLTADHFDPETRFAGIPLPTIGEMDSAPDYGMLGLLQDFDTTAAFKPAGEKIGVDGKLHPVDEWGAFKPLLNESDIYGDNTGVPLSAISKNQDDIDWKNFVDDIGGYYYICPVFKGAE